MYKTKIFGRPKTGLLSFRAETVRNRRGSCHFQLFVLYTDIRYRILMIKAHGWGDEYVADVPES
jgi:hypothetical protein